MAKLIEAQSKSKKTDSEIASQGTENALKMEELKTNLATRQSPTRSLTMRFVGCYRGSERA
jgi:hypothetical protein